MKGAILCALILFSWIVATAQPNSSVYLEQGKLLYQQSKFDSALVAFRNAIEVDSTDPHAFYWRARAIEMVYGSKLDMKLAMQRKDYGKALQLKPHWGDACIRMGMTYKIEGNYKMARLLILKGLQVDPNCAEADQGYVSLSYMAYKEGNNDEACIYARLANEKMPWVVNKDALQILCGK